MTTRPSLTRKVTTWISDNWLWLVIAGMLLIFLGIILASSGLLGNDLTLAWIIGGSGVLVLVLVFFAKLSGPEYQSGQTGGVAVVLIILAIILVGAMLFVVTRDEMFERAPEARIGALIILGASVLMVLLFIMAIGFASVHLANPNEAMGLPEGSIRALIALLLILIFIIMGLHLYSSVTSTFAREFTGLSGHNWPDFQQIDLL